MAKLLSIGILRETKKPPDRRVPLAPDQIRLLMERYPSVNFIVQSSPLRCYSDEEYRLHGIAVTEDLSECDVLLGVKEVDKRTFIPGKTYMFFAHVGKKQPYNREMFRTMAEKNISLIDYEYLTKDTGERVVAFGRWAGIVGAYNGLRAWGIKTGSYFLKPAHKCHNHREMVDNLKSLVFNSPLKIIVTGEGRVAGGALETLASCNILRVGTAEFVNREYNVPVVCQIGPGQYVEHREKKPFSFEDFIRKPEEYVSAFMPYAGAADLLVTGHYWDPRSPKLFTIDEMTMPGFRIKVIADVTCDIDGSVPSTIRATSIDSPFYDYDPVTRKELEAFSDPSAVTVMSIDNLPGELPRDASVDFGSQLINSVLPDILSGRDSPAAERATILRCGKLTERFAYLDDYLNFDAV
jgi:alanine dehydrogenase